MTRIEPADFDKLVDKAMEDPNRRTMRPVVEKELLHFDMLFALDKERLLEGLTFQGGTSLRLCYGAPRFSEDLDFVGGRDFSHRQVSDIKDCLEDYLGQRYGLEVAVKAPDALREDSRYADIRVDRWQVSVITAPARPDLPHQRIKLEIANVPAHTRQAQRLRLHYTFLPDGYGDLLVSTESMNEILADKLVSLINTQRYVRYRDIWDLQWLKQQGAQPDLILLRQKLEDYRVDGYIPNARAFIERLPDLIHGQPFLQEMTRFLPTDALDRTLHDDRFADFLARELAQTFDAVIASLEGKAPSAPPFRL